MDPETYGELAHAICAAGTLAELQALEQRLRALPPDPDTEELSEMLAMQRRGLEADPA